MKKIFLLFLMIAALCTAGKCTVHISAAEDCSLTMICDESGVEWNLYAAGNADKSGNLIMTGEFAPIYLPDITASNGNFGKHAGMLADFVREKKVPSLMKAYSDEKGRVVFTGLEEGFYLAVPEILVTAEQLYICSPAAVYIGGEEPERRNLTAYPKKSEYLKKETSTDTDDFTKHFRFDEEDHWNNHYNYSFYTNNLIITTVPDITDTVVTDTDVTETDTYVTTAVTSDTEPPAVTVPPETSIRTDSHSDEEKLPQTGQLWFPVPVLSGLGILLGVLGYIIRKNDNE